MGETEAGGEEEDESDDKRAWITHQTGQRQVSGSEGKDRGGQGNGVGGRANEVRQVGTSV